MFACATEPWFSLFVFLVYERMMCDRSFAQLNIYNMHTNNFCLLVDAAHQIQFTLIYKYDDGIVWLWNFINKIKQPCNNQTQKTSTLFSFAHSLMSIIHSHAYMQTQRSAKIIWNV